MPAHIRKGLITGAPAFNSGGLGLSIGSRTGGSRRMISARAPDSGKITSNPVPEIEPYKLTIPDGYTYAAYDQDNGVYSGGTIVNYSPDSDNTPYISYTGFTYADEAATLHFARKKIALLEGINVFLSVTKQVGYTNFPESLVSNTATTNVYTIALPSIAGTSNGSNWYYVEGNYVYQGTDAPTDGSVIVVSGYADDQNGLTLLTEDYQTYINGRTYTLTMTADDTFTISGQGITSNFVFGLG